MKLIENPVIFLGRFVRQDAGAALKPVSPIPGCAQAPDLHLDFFAGRESEILAQLNRSAVDLSENDSGHFDLRQDLGVHL